MTISTLTRAGAALALVSMLVGHIAAPDLSWTRDPISTYAAHAPLSVCITIAILVSAATILLVGIEVSRIPNAAYNFISAVIPLASGASAAGLILLATFKETISKTISLSVPTIDQARLQAFHDAGLFLFFYSSLALLILVGVVWFRIDVGPKRFCALIPIAMSVASWYVLARGPFPANAFGLKQRIGLLLIWLGLAAFAYFAPRPSQSGGEKAGST
jgi:hypothetical protein